MSRKLAYIFDIDGTLADCRHRLRFILPPAGGIYDEELDWKPDWKSFYEQCPYDQPIEDVCRVCRELGYPVIYITGRPQEYREQTDKWITYNDLPGGLLFMRQDGDHRPDYEYKREIYKKYIEGHYNILGVFEDRTQCVDMWRELGLTCFQVAKGDY